MNTKLQIVTICFLVALLPAFFVAGCGGGVATESNVVIKPSTPDSPSGPVESKPPEVQTAVDGFGTLKGRVIFEGTPPSLPLLITKGQNIKDKAICAATDLPNERLLVGPGGGVKNVFVYLAKTPELPEGEEIPPPPEEAAVFDQKGCKFFPHAMVVRTGQTVNILSGDAIAHNTHAFPKRSSPFNQVIPPNDRKGVAFTYAKPETEPREVKCDFHTWMIAYHLPLDHPYGAVTAEDGTFEIKNMPAGKHKLRVWHEAAKGKFLSRGFSVEVVKDELEPDPYKIPYPATKFDE